MPKVLFVSAEIFPMAKVGGLGDVSGALPQALRRRGLDVRLMMPAYPSAMRHVTNISHAWRFKDLRGLGAVDILAGKTARGNVPIFLVRSERFFERAGGPYFDDRGNLWPDSLQRFGLLSNAAASFVQTSKNWRPSLVHLNDWHTALAASLLQSNPASVVPCLLTIHNMAYQGSASIQQLQSFGVPVEQLKRLPERARSFLGLGVLHANHLSTVSPTYSKEIQTAKFGCGLQRLLAARAHNLTGILNGVDYAIWNPSRDYAIPSHYDANNLQGKARCKASLIGEMGLESTRLGPVLGIVSRLTHQKGLDLVPHIAKQLVAAGAKLVVLGEGEKEIERSFRSLASRFRKSVAVHIEYNEELAHRIIAGSDIFVMPSRFEPCGLNQMYSLKYGTVPVVSPVGGLLDSVTDAGQSGIVKGATTGFVMRHFGSAPLAASLKKAFALYARSALWKSLQGNGMRQDFSWSHAAEKYHVLYCDILSRNRVA